ncbi:2-isopropylmalate synthase [Xenorhabdus stockiae]|uniref:2-isopropylmalate synthase n=1 Tax=Xenorhabdus stockiae TaxID=351614 RepID=A0A2D0KN68_9GAMM|nr:pyruvate carboxyltransferase [Xenorhabdus stockiae]PHM64862.1 2-isopropylmalate synthase [Xenorhabdus stockiae]
MNKVSILDTTLRDGEQAPENAMNPEQKLKIALKLEELGVDHIETGFPASSNFDYQATKLISKEITQSGIATFSRTLIKDIQLALDAAGTDKNHTIQMVATGSDLHLKNKRNITRAQSINEVIQSVQFAKQNSDCRISVGIEDASRADFQFMGEIVKASVDAGAQQIILADTTGHSNPYEFKEIIKFIKSQAGQGISISTHCHNDLGLALANTLAGIEGGADEVQVTLGGIGERAGNASLEMVASNLYFKSQQYNAYTNIDLSKMYSTYKILCEVISMPIPRNQPIFGKYAFGTAAGIHQQGILSNPDTYEFVKPNIFNRQREFFVSRHSGKSIIKYLLQQQGITSNVELIEELYEVYINSRSESNCLSMNELQQQINKHILLNTQVA